MILPAGLLLTKTQHELPTDNRFSEFTLLFAKFTQNSPKMIAVMSLLIVLVSLVGMTQLKVENRFIDYFDPDTEIFQGMLVIDKQLGGTLPLDVVLTRPKNEKPAASSEQAVNPELELEDDFFDDEDDFFSDESTDFSADTAADSNNLYAGSYWFSRAGLAEVEKVHRFIESLDGSGKVLSLATLFQVLKDISQGQVDDIQLAIIQENAEGVIADTLIKPYLSADGEQARLSIRVKETSESLNRSEMLSSIAQFLQEEMAYEESSYELTGMMVMYNNMLQSLYSSQILTLGAVFVAIMAMFALLFGSFKLALLAILPNVLAATFVLGTMGWFGIPLDIMTITIAAITIGIGVDDTIHYVHRFSRELQHDGDYLAAMHRSHASIGRAMFYTSFIIISGFSILALSNFTPSLYFGVLTGLAMFAALLGALILLPLLLVLIKPFPSATVSSGELQA